MGEGEWLRIKSNQKIAEQIYSMEMQSMVISQSAQAGQFIHLLCGKEYGAFLRRPFSLCTIDQKNKEVSIVYRVQGKGTKSLSEMKKGESIHALGPLGKGFLLDSSCQDVAIVAGGMGSAPLMEIIKYYGEQSRVYLGFEKECILVEKIKKYCNKIWVTTEKGNIGKNGLIIEDLLSQWKECPPQMVYTCGPRGMMKEVVNICKELDLPCQVSMEERMGCGIGACLVCSCKTKKKGQKNQYTRVCKDGPVYWGSEVVWDE